MRVWPFRWALKMMTVCNWNCDCWEYHYCTVVMKTGSVWEFPYMHTDHNIDRIEVLTLSSSRQKFWVIGCYHNTIFTALTCIHGLNTQSQCVPSPYQVTRWAAAQNGMAYSARRRWQSRRWADPKPRRWWFPCKRWNYQLCGRNGKILDIMEKSNKTSWLLTIVISRYTLEVQSSDTKEEFFFFF